MTIAELTPQPCPNCGSSVYIETPARESCSACGLVCDYHGGGANNVYEAMMARDAEVERQRQEERRLREREREENDE